MTIRSSLKGREVVGVKRTMHAERTTTGRCTQLVRRGNRWLAPVAVDERPRRSRGGRSGRPVTRLPTRGRASQNGEGDASPPGQYPSQSKPLKVHRVKVHHRFFVLPIHPHHPPFTSPGPLYPYEELFGRCCLSHAFFRGGSPNGYRYKASSF